jgi:ATP-dependent DNA helicase DinG
MRQRAMESDIVIVNHHPFFADLALRDARNEGGILPRYHAVVFDEAHDPLGSRELPRASVY